MRVLLALMVLASAVFAADVVWTRFTGKVKSVNQKTSMLTIQNADGDLIGFKVDGDVWISSGKEQVKLADLKIDDKVTLLYQPKADQVKDSDQPPEGGVYSPSKK